MNIFLPFWVATCSIFRRTNWLLYIEKCLGQLFSMLRYRKSDDNFSILSCCFVNELHFFVSKPDCSKMMWRMTCHLWKKYINWVLKQTNTLYNAILRIARNFLETRENIKISTHPFYHINLAILKNELFLSRPFWMSFLKKKFFLLHSHENQPKFIW